MDNHTPEQRRKNMKAVKNKDSKIERLLRKELWSRGLRYRKNYKKIIGKPDIVFVGKKVAVFCDSEFWHGYDWENKKNEIQSRREFWIPKIERNMQRDIEVSQTLENEGWTVLRFWGNDIKKKTKECADIIERAVTAKMKVFRSIDLFAGIGGIRLGFERAFKNQIETVFVSEWDEYAQKTYRANFEDDFEIAGDITKIDESDVPEFDICLAGFPCQAFSLAGKRQGFDDNYKGLCRGTLFLDVARICEHHHPSAIFCENVKGLVIHDRGRTLQIIKKTFTDLGYTVFTNNDTTLNSKNFGVPQNRERIYIVAFRNDIAPEKFEFPQGNDDTKRIKDIIDRTVKHDDIYYYGPESQYFKTLNAKIIDKTGIYRIDDSGVATRKWNICPTLKANMGTFHDRVPIVRDNFGIRKLTPMECLAFQGYPKDYTFKKITLESAYKQCGNTVCIPIVHSIANNIATQYKGDVKNAGLD